MFNIWVYLTFAYLHTWKIVGMKTFAPSLLSTLHNKKFKLAQLDLVQTHHVRSQAPK
jgi:hypothetical protein